MPNTRTYFRSFAGGEISPEMYGRLDDAKFQSGAALLRNFISVPQGPAENRPGMRYVNPTKNNGVARLIPFTYNTTQTMVIELGVGYIRFHTQGGSLTTGTCAAYNAATAYVIGDLVNYSGTDYYCIQNGTNKTPSTNPTYWYALTPYVPYGSFYEIPSPYQAADLFDIHYVQSADVLTLVHQNYAPRELRRYGALNWRLQTIGFAGSLSAPTGVSVTAASGEALTITAAAAGSPATFDTASQTLFANGESVYIKGIAGTGGFALADGFYVILGNPTTTAPFRFSLKYYDTGLPVNIAAGTYTANSGKVQSGSRIADIDNYYVVTAVGKTDGTESAASSAANVVNNLYVNGSYNTIAWSAVSGAVRYNVYKRQSGLYGYIGQTSALSFTDNNIAPDMGITPPIYDTVFASSGNYPGTVSYFEQRRVFAGTINEPQTIWMTRSGTESDMSYSIPTKDSDRVSFRVASREADAIRHVVPLTQLLLLTSGSEWRASPINSDVLTPTTFSVRPQSYVGASNVQPLIVNNVVVYPSARGGHVRELGYNWQAQGFITGDLSLRSAHLFDGLTIVDACTTKAPRPVLWFVSSNGKLLGLTYVPEEQLGAWHQHDTDGLFESCTAVAEGDNDIVYVIVKRTVNGNTVRYIECMVPRQINALETCVFVDSAITYDYRNTTATTMTLTIGGGTWAKGQTLLLTRSTGGFSVGEIGTTYVITDANGTEYSCKITFADGSAVANCIVDKDIPVSMQGVARTSWAWAPTQFSVPHLQGKTVSVLADGAVVPQQTVSVGFGSITLPQPASVVAIGLPYQSDLQTLPMVINTDGFGQGRMKNVNKAWLRVYKSSGIFIGPDADHLVEAKQRTTEPYGSPPALKSDEILVVMTPAWAASGQVYVRQSDPLPLTVVGLTTEVSIGG